MKIKNILYKIYITGNFTVTVLLMGCTIGQKNVSGEDFTYSDISRITVDNDSWNLNINSSNDEEIHVAYSGKVKTEKDIQVSLEGTELIIQQNDNSSKNPIDQFSFEESGKITLSLPKDTIIPMEIQNASGDMAIKNVNLSEFRMENSSGSLTISDVNAENADFFSDSGDIKITDSSCGTINVSTKSAYVTLKNTEIKEAAVSTDSGEVGISNTSDYTTLSVNTGSGDISLSHKASPDNLSYDISSNSKDITLKLQNTNPVSDREDCKQGAVGKGEHTLSITSESGTVVIK